MSNGMRACAQGAGEAAVAPIADTTSALARYADRPTGPAGRTLLRLCAILFSSLYASILICNSAYAYQVTPTVAGAVTTPEGLALPFQNTATANATTFTIPLASGSAANIQANVLPSSFRIAAWAARVVTPGSGGALSPFMLEYLADRYIYPADDGGFVQALQPMTPDPTTGKVARNQKTYVGGYDPASLGFTPYTGSLPAGEVLPVGVEAWLFQYPSGIEVAGDWQPGVQTVFTCVGGFAYNVYKNALVGGISSGLIVGCAGSGNTIDRIWDVAFFGTSTVALPSPDPVVVDAGTLPASQPMPTTANEPIPVEITFPQPYVDGEAYTDSSTGNRVKTHYLVEPGPGLASLANAGQIAPPTVNVTETTVSASAEYPPKNNGGCNAGVPNEGNPINASIGNKWQSESDIDGVAAPGFARMYNSNPATGNSSLGNGWAYTYSRSLSLQPIGSDSQAVSRPDGRSYTFNAVAGGWASEADIPDQLVEIKDTNGVRTGWRYTVAADDSVETYSTSGKLLSIADRSGRTQILVYDLPSASGGDDDPETLDTVTDDTGRQLVFTYDAQKRIATITDPSGGLTSYGYDEQNNLISVTYPDASSKTYHYNEPENTSGANLPHALTGITDENGTRYAIYQYDASGKAIATGHANGADLYTLAFNPDGSTTVTDPLGAQRTHNLTTVLGVVKSTGQSQPGGSGCGPAASAVTYDANGNIASRADFNGHLTCYVYDLTRNLETARVEGLASGSICPANLAAYTPAANTVERKILTDWDSRFRLPVKITEAGRETSAVYDSHGNFTSLSMKDTASGKTRTWTTTYTYHASVPGILVQKVEDGPRTDVADLTTTDYYAPDAACIGDPLGCRGQVRQVTNALGHTTHYDQYDANGRVLQITDANGLVTTFSYSPRGWLVSRTVGTETTSFGYDGVGQLTGLTSPDGSYLAYAYDSAHRLTQITDTLGNQIVYTLDAMGNRIKEEVFDSTGILAQSRQREFDALNRLWKDIGALGQTTRYEYDAQGNLKQSIDPLLHASASSFDALDRLIQVNDPSGSQTRQTLDAFDQVTSVTDPKAVVTSYSYNGLGDLVSETSPDRGLINYSYNEAGELVSRKDLTGVSLYYNRDVLNRLTSIKSMSGDAIRFQATLTYDDGANAVGRLTSINSYGGGYQRYRYDEAGRLLHKEEGLGGELPYDLVYDTAGHLVQQTYPSGTLLSTTYGADGRPVGIWINGNVLVSDIVYQPFGLPKAWTWGDGSSYTREFDNDGRITQYPIGADIRLLTFDDAGRIIHTGHLDSGLNRDYDYDILGRLIGEVDNVGSSQWTYDANSNRTSAQPGGASYAYTYPATNNRLSNVAGPVPKTYTYDAAGNTTSDGNYTYTYDKLGRLASVWQGSVRKAAYSVNALGQRTSKYVDGVTTYFFYDEAGQLIGEYDGNYSPIQETVWLEGIPIAVVKKDPATGQTQIYYIHADHLNSPRAILDSSNSSIVWKWNSDAFGQGQPDEDPDGDGKKFIYNLRFPGQYYDKETGLHYNYFRDYDPTTGRYLEADPMGLAAGPNVYAYVSGDPISYVDPTGLARQLDPNSAECQQLRKKIQNKKADINNRICEVKANPNKLPYYPPYPEAPPRMSVQGHEGLIQDLKDGLSDDQALYASKCGGGGGGSATAPVTPAPDNSGIKNAAGAVVKAGAAYWIISEGLRVLFPPRNLVPVP